MAGIVLLLVRSILCMFRMLAVFTGLELRGLSWGEEWWLLPMPLQQNAGHKLNKLGDLFVKRT